MTYSFTDGGDGSLHVLRDGTYLCSIHGSEVSVVKNTTQSVVELSDSEHVFISINVNQVSGATTLQDIVDAIEAALPNDSDGGGVGSVGTLQQVTDAGADTTNSMNVTSGGGAEPKSTISPSQVRAGNNGTQLESTLNSDGTVKATDNGNSTYTKLNPDGSISLAYGASGASVIGFKKIHLTSAQIQAGATPIVLVAAAGAGTAIYAWHDTTARCVNGVVGATATQMDILSDTGTAPQIRFKGGFMASATNNPLKGDDSFGVDIDTAIIENANLVAMFDSDNAGFDGTIDIYLKYEIITL